MLLIKSVPGRDVLADLRTYECRSCGVTYTEAAGLDAKLDDGANRSHRRL